MALNFKTLLTRTLTAAVFVAVLLSAICYNYFSFTFLFTVVSILALREFYIITEKLGAQPYKVWGLFMAVFIHIGNLIKVYVPIFPITSLSIAIVFLIFISGLFSKRENIILNLGYTVLGILYTTIPFVLLNNVSCIIENSVTISPDTWLLDIPSYNHVIVLGMILLIWASDTFAYLVGSLIGRTKLNERISPGKTWEGTIGGGVLTMASSYVIAGWFPEIAFKHWLVISVLVVIFGTLGDLFESLLKRQAGIKDSGKIMPGHGGILDRFDSLIFVTPFVYLYLSWVLS